MVLQVGDVLAVRVCARYPQRVNNAHKGYIVARTLSEGVFSRYRVIAFIKLCA